MNFFTFTKLGRTMLLAGVVAVSAVCWMGCSGDDGGNDNPADNNSNTGGNNNGSNNSNNGSNNSNNGSNNSNNGGNNNNGGGSSETVSLGGLKWMKKNLNVEAAESWCYDGDPANCNKYGRLYTWSAAKTACQSAGMRLPTREEWNALVTAAGGADTAGSKLKSSTGWNSYSGISSTDEFHFSALPGGCRYSHGCSDLSGNNGLWWTATEHGSYDAYGRVMYYNNDYVTEFDYDKSYGFSVRCVKD